MVQLNYQAMEWRKQHFLTSLMVTSSATLSFSLPLFLRKKLYIHHSFHGSIMFASLKREPTGRKNQCLVLPYAVLKYCGKKLLNVEGPTFWSKMETRRLPMKYLFPRGVIDISVYLKKTKSSVHAILVAF